MGITQGITLQVSLYCLLRRAHPSPESKHHPQVVPSWTYTPKSNNSTKPWICKSCAYLTESLRGHPSLSKVQKSSSCIDPQLSTFPISISGTFSVIVAQTRNSWVIFHGFHSLTSQTFENLTIGDTHLPSISQTCPLLSRSSHHPGQTHSRCFCGPWQRGTIGFVPSSPPVHAYQLSAWTEKRKIISFPV